MAEFNLDQYLENMPEGKGNLNKNLQKKQDTHPDYRGYCRVQGQVYEIGGWIKENNGKKRLSISLKPFTAPPAAPPAPVTPKAKYADDDMPF